MQQETEQCFTFNFRITYKSTGGTEILVLIKKESPRKKRLDSKEENCHYSKGSDKPRSHSTSASFIVPSSSQFYVRET